MIGIFRIADKTMIRMRKNKIKKTYIRKENFNGMPPEMKMDEYISQITKEYDVFINFMIFSRHVGKAKVNIYQCMFPPKTYMMQRQKGFLNYLYAKKADFIFSHSYHCFISNSEYTNSRWSHNPQNKYFLHYNCVQEYLIEGHNDNIVL